MGSRARLGLAFPDRAQARKWYTSPAYQAILPLRTNISCDTIHAPEGLRQDDACPPTVDDRAHAGTVGWSRRQ